jgi:hypothetical protein
MIKKQTADDTFTIFTTEEVDLNDYVPKATIRAKIAHHEGHGISITYDDNDIIEILKDLLGEKK